MNDLLAMRVFASVVQNGSISGASRSLNMSISAVSRYVNFVEDELGVRLLNRTTRTQSLTEAGEFYYLHATKILREFELIKRNVSSYNVSVEGLLRVQCRSSVGASIISNAIPDFSRRHPSIKVELILDDQQHDLVYEGIDLAVWLGKLEDSSMIAKRLSPSNRYLVASPEFLERNSVPRHPLELQNHNCLIFTGGNSKDRWIFERDGEVLEVPVSGSFKCNNSQALLNCARGGMGFALLHSWMVRSALENGELVPVLTEYNITPNDLDTALYAVYPYTKVLPLKVRVFIDFLAELFSQKPQVETSLRNDLKDASLV